MTFFKLYLIAVPVFFALDLLWLGVLAKNFYQKQIGQLLRPDVNWVAAVIFYLVFLIGLTVFVIQPAYDKGSLFHALKYGALFGLVTYAAYDLTNLAVAKGWTVTVTVVDLIWGALLSALVSAIVYWLATRF